MNDIDLIAQAMFDKLIADDDDYALAQGTRPDNITLDGNFDLTELARVALETLQKAGRY